MVRMNSDYVSRSIATSVGLSDRCVQGVRYQERGSGIDMVMAVLIRLEPLRHQHQRRNWNFDQ